MNLNSSRLNLAKDNQIQPLTNRSGAGAKRHDAISVHHGVRGKTPKAGRSAHIRGGSIKNKTIESVTAGSSTNYQTLQHSAKHQ